MLDPLPTSRTLLFALALHVLSPRQARAEDLTVESDRVTLAMILPALEGTELGALDIADAPLPGETRVIRASDVMAKLRETGRSPRGLAIPRSVRVVRPARSIGVKELDALVRKALAPRVAPCTVEQLSTLSPVTIAAGEFLLTAEPMPRKASGRTSAVITLTQGEHTQRISAQAVLHCPEPVVMPGAQLRLVVVVGAVRVSAPGVAAQPGRVGDEIRVTNSLTRKSLKARVLDAQSAEVVP